MENTEVIIFRSACVKNVSDIHKQLYHYTNFKGLEGILKTQTLWATHYKALNDLTEVEHMRATLEAAVYPTIKELLQARSRNSLSFKQELDRDGGLLACSRDEAKKQVAILYGAMFGGESSVDPIADPYVVSFCAHTNHTNYVKENGLLSQWRAYGDKGGFALVFDTRRLDRWMEAERKQYLYSGWYLDDVVYDDHKNPFADEFPDLADALDDYIRAQAEGEELPAGKVAEPFFHAVTRFKHQGFIEESEVRIIASPTTKASFEKIKRAAKNDAEIPNKELKPVEVRDGKTRYIVLSGAPDKTRLPIERIIVGPQRDQEACVQQIKALPGWNNIPIFSSKTPYIHSRV